MTITPAVLAESVIAVPPLARQADLSIAREANLSIIRYLEAGGVKTLLYGGNANFYHIRLSEYANLLSLLTELPAAGTHVVPSVGPAYGTMMDQAEIVRDFQFPTVMVLPHRELATPAGISIAVRQFVERAGIPVVLYVKHDGWLDVPTIRGIVDEGLVSWIKYAIVRDAPEQDDFLKELTEHVDPQIIVSGIGEQPAIVHLRDFGINSFTSGCVCVAPAMSMRMLRAIKGGDYDAAESLRAEFEPLEDLRNEIHPIRVLHDAVRLADIADTGPILPLLSATSDEQQQQIGQAATALRQQEASTMVS